MIEGKGFVLRAVRSSDLEELFELVRREELLKSVHSEPKFQQKFNNTGFWEETEGAVLILKKKRIAGLIEYHQATPFEGLALTFCVFKEQDRSVGLMSAALSLFSLSLFEMKKIERLQLFIPDYNKAAIRVAQKCLFQFEGIARRALFHRGAFRDLCLYALLRREVEKIPIHPESSPA
ncbi:MAG: GNAT family N-acetyltransferase [Chlamydiae bacterium]|nr:GNAT family N-acetyltransferase [Chlamydiota bacterium]